MSREHYTILFVEDDRVDQKAFEYLVKQHKLHYQYHICNSVADALETMEHSTFDVILTDYCLGDGTGLDILHAAHNTPVIVTTGAGNEDIAVQAMKSGACDYLIKDNERNYLKVLPHVIESTIRNERSNRQLEHIRLHNQKLLEVIPLILIGIDDHFRITTWNCAAENVFGIKSEDVIGKPFLDCGINWNWKHIAALISDCQRTHDLTALSDIRFEDMQGRKGRLNLHIKPLFPHEDDSTGFLVMGEDITERCMLENQLSEAQRFGSMGKLTAGFTNEISEPLRTVTASLRQITSNWDETTHLLEHCRQQHKGDKALTKLTELSEDAQCRTDAALLELHRVNQTLQAMYELAETHRNEKPKANVNRIIESVVIIARPHWKKIADIHMEFDPDLPPIDCSPDIVSQVILHILTNAIDSIKEQIRSNPEKKGMVNLKTSLYSQWIQIQISDTGIGIPEELAEHIYEPFFSTKELGKSTGQGLAICKSLIEKIGGMITFNSAVGKGASFTIHLKTEKTEPSHKTKKITSK